MRVHILQHVEFEGPAEIAAWALAGGHAVAFTHLWRNDPLSTVHDFDLLVVLGGPMSVNDEGALPWLVAEKRVVREAIAAGKALLGVCLGAQMIANVLGARVYPGPQKEIGWSPVHRVSQAGAGAVLPGEFTPLHWHGETFDLPLGAELLASTDAVPHQAFQFGRRVVGLQFHLEATPESVSGLAVHCASEIEQGKPGQQTVAEIVEQAPRASRLTHPLQHNLLDYLSEGLPKAGGLAPVIPIVRN
ncbi:MAG: amidotransferase [Acidobacteriota bacterium]|nr:amidotransferase [Acidobacteriota bacterium]